MRTGGEILRSDANLGSDVNGGTTLHYAAAAASYECTELLIRKKANVDLLSKGMRTLLWYGALNVNLRLVQLLVANGANPNFQDRYDDTPMDVLFSDGPFHPSVIHKYYKAPKEGIPCFLVEGKVPDVWRLHGAYRRAARISQLEILPKLRLCIAPSSLDMELLLTRWILTTPS